MRRSFLAVAALAVGCAVVTSARAQAPAGATARCKDGTYSTATTTRGMCSGHGGVDVRLTAGAAAATAAPAARAAAAPAARAAAAAPAAAAAAAGRAPAGATARCKDGTYSTATTTRGMCSGHGGVDVRLTATAAAAPAAAAAAPAAAAAAAAPAAAARAAAPVAAAPAAAARATAPAAAAASGKAPTVARPAGAPANATAKCRDNTFSTSQQHSGTCSNHGGVAEWYQ